MDMRRPFAPLPTPPQWDGVPTVGERQCRIAERRRQDQKGAAMRAIRLALRLTLFYAAVTAIVALAVNYVPGFRDYIPIGGAQNLLTGAAHDPFTAIEIGAEGVDDLQESLAWLIVAVIGAILTVIPLAWTYIAVRTHEEYDQSLVETIIVIPIAVTSIVIIVNESLALAFGLAGIVGGVRFRNTLKSPGDALYVLAAIGVGLAAGVGALEIALVMTVIFNYCFVALWLTDFGARKGAHRYMRHADKQPHDDDAPGNGGKHKNKHKESESEAEPAPLV
jgi:hypothetical protein